MLIYTRWVPLDAVALTMAHIVAHLSSIASSHDDPEEYSSEVQVTAVAKSIDGIAGKEITGTLDREPEAPYLQPGWTPEQDIKDNPLTVKSVREGQ